MKKKRKPEENVPFMSDQYSFSHADNTVKKTFINPNIFLKTTLRESNRRYRKRNEISPFGMDLKKFEKRVIFPENVQHIKSVLQGKKKSKWNIPRPFLEFNELGEPTGHEGRNTMVAMRKMGIKKAPVTIVRRKR